MLAVICLTGPPKTKQSTKREHSTGVWLYSREGRVQVVARSSRSSIDGCVSKQLQ